MARRRPEPNDFIGRGGTGEEAAGRGGSGQPVPGAPGSWRGASCARALRGDGMGDPRLHSGCARRGMVPCRVSTSKRLTRPMAQPSALRMECLLGAGSGRFRKLLHSGSSRTTGCGMCMGVCAWVCVHMCAWVCGRAAHICVHVCTHVCAPVYTCVRVCCTGSQSGTGPERERLQCLHRKLWAWGPGTGGPGSVT